MRKGLIGAILLLVIFVTDSSAMSILYPWRRTKTPTPAPTSTPTRTSTFTPTPVPQPGSADQPGGTFSIDAVSTQSYVDGTLIRMAWSAIQTGPTTYNWTALDNALAQVTTAKKRATIAIFDTLKPPSWLWTNGVSSWVDGQGNTLPIPWDPTFLGYWKGFISALGTRYSTNPTLYMVNAFGPSGSTNLTGTPPGYTDSLFIGAWENVLDAWATAFPTKFLAIPVRYTSNTTPTLTIRDYAVGKYNTVFKQFGVFGDMLTGASPQSTSAFAKIFTPAVNSWSAFQACGVWSAQAQWTQCNWALSDTPDLGFQHASSFKALYIEFYPTDLNNSAYTTIFTSHHQ